MKNLISHLKPVHWLLARFGYTIGVIGEQYPHVSQDYKDIYKICRPYTMCGENVVYTALRVIDNLVLQQFYRKHLRIVQCGTWRGGLAGAVALRLKYHQRKGNLQTFHIHIMDTFEGLPKPTEQDSLEDFATWAKRGGTDKGSNWCNASLEEVRGNLKTILHENHISGHEFSFWMGLVEDLIPELCKLDESERGFHFLMLDTDFYSSTKVELDGLFPLLKPYCYMMIDDYGGLQGCRTATDEYWNKCKRPEMLMPIDLTAVLVQKLED